MKSHLLKALRLYKWLSLAFVASYLPLIIYDDFVLIEQIESLFDFALFVVFEALFMFGYFSGFTVTYWSAAFLVILVQRFASAPPRG